MSLLRRGPRTGRKAAPDPLKIGVIAILLIVVVTYAAFHKRVPFSGRWTLHADFANTTQIISGSPVRIAGVTVGSVTGVSRGPGASALLTMALESRALPLHRDARLAIRPRLFLEGGYYVELDPGSPSAPTIDSGYTVPLSRTTTPVQFFTVISTLNAPVRDSFTTALREFSIGLSGGGAEGFDQLVRELPGTFKYGALFTQAAQGQQPNDVLHLVQGSSRVLGTLAAHEASLGGLVSNFNSVAGALASQSIALSATIRQFDATLVAAPPALTALDGALPPLERFSNDIRPALQEAPPILRKAVTVLHEFDALSRPSQLPRLLGLARPLLAELPLFASRLQDLFPRVAPVATCISNQAIPALNTTLGDGALSTGRPVWQDLLHGLQGLGGDAANFDGNGPYFRVLGGAGATFLNIVPALGPVLNSGSFIGTRPAWNGSDGGPPLRPDVSCTTQPLANLQAPVAPATALRAVGRPTAPAMSARRFLHLLHPRRQPGAGP